MSAVLVAAFNDYATADGVRTRLVKDGFPTWIGKVPEATLGPPLGFAITGEALHRHELPES